MLAGSDNGAASAHDPHGSLWITTGRGPSCWSPGRYGEAVVPKDPRNEATIRDAVAFMRYERARRNAKIAVISGVLWLLFGAIAIQGFEYLTNIDLNNWGFFLALLGPVGVAAVIFLIESRKQWNLGRQHGFITVLDETTLLNRSEGTPDQDDENCTSN